MKKNHWVVPGVLLLLAIGLIWQQHKTARLLKVQTDSLSAINTKLDSFRPTGNDEKVTQALTALRDELIRYRAEQQLSSSDPSQVLSATIDQALATITDPSVENPYEPLVKVVKLKPDWKSVDTYQEARAGSKVVGQIIADQSYIVEDNLAGWHKIRLNSSKSGWVQDQFINEIN